MVTLKFKIDVFDLHDDEVIFVAVSVTILAYHHS